MLHTRAGNQWQSALRRKFMPGGFVLCICGLMLPVSRDASLYVILIFSSTGFAAVWPLVLKGDGISMGLIDNLRIGSHLPMMSSIRYLLYFKQRLAIGIQCQL